MGVRDARSFELSLEQGDLDCHFRGLNQFGKHAEADGNSIWRGADYKFMTHINNAAVSAKTHAHVEKCKPASA